MQVTNEMAARVAEAMLRYYQRSAGTPGPVEVARVVLEAAAAELPEPDEALRQHLVELASTWRSMARDEDDPAVAWARKSCSADLLALLAVKP